MRIPSLYLIATTDVPVTYGYLNQPKNQKQKLGYMVMLPNTNSLKFPNPKSVYTCIYLEREREKQHTGFFESQLQRREGYYADWIDLIPLSTAKRAKNGCSVSV